MKKITALLFLTCVLFTLVACKNAPTQDPAPPVEDPQPPAPPTVETPQPQPVKRTEKVLADENGKELVKIAIRLPEESGSTAFEQIGIYFKTWLEDTMFYAENMLLDGAKQAGAASDFKPYTLNSDFTVARRDAAVYSIERSMDVVAGADVSQSHIFETFSMENGGRLSIFDLWNVEEGWQNVLWTEMCAQVPQLDGKEPDFEAFPFDFSLTTAGISVFRNLTLQDEPANTRFDVSYDKIKPLLQEKWIYSNDK